MPQIELVPTGGVSLATAQEFLEAGAFALGVGGELVDAGAIRAGKPEVVTENARKYIEIVKRQRVSELASQRVSESAKTVNIFR